MAAEYRKSHGKAVPSALDPEVISRARYNAVHGELAVGRNAETGGPLTAHERLGRSFEVQRPEAEATRHDREGQQSLARTAAAAKIAAQKPEPIRRRARAQDQR